MTRLDEIRARNVAQPVWLGPQDALVMAADRADLLARIDRALALHVDDPSSDFDEGSVWGLGIVRRALTEDPS